MSVTIQQRRDSAANWTATNPVLHQGEIGIETDTGKAKAGDGSTAWTSLAYWSPSGTSGAVASVFGRTGAVAAANGDYTATQVGADASGAAAAALTSAEAYADTNKLAKSANLSDLASPGTARTSLGLGSAATQNTSAFDAAGAATAAQAAAIAASLPTLAQASVSASGTLALNTVTNVTAATALTMTLPTATTGALIVVERASASTANVAVTGNIRGVAAQTVTLQLSNESEAFFGTGASWWPIAGHKTLSSLQALFAGASTGTNDPVELRASVMAPYWARLAGRSASPVDHIWIGDSITEGQNATALGARWVDLLLKTLRVKHQPAGIVGGFGYYPAWYNIGTLASAWTTAGSPAQASNGLGVRAYSLASTGQSMSLTFTGTGCDIHYYKSSAGGNFTVTVDGGSPQTVSSNAVTASDGNRYQVRGLTAGTHTVVVAWSSAANVIEGAMAYNGDESLGVRAYEAGHGGMKSSDLVTYLSAYQAWVAAIQPALITVQIGSNDINNSVSAATFQANLQTVLAGLVSAVPSGSPATILVWDDYNAFGFSVAQWAPYRAAILAAVAATAVPAYVGLAVIDMLPRMGGNVAADALHLTADNTHPNNAGSQLIADAVAGFAAPNGAGDGTPSGTAASLTVTGLTGALVQSRYVGANASGAPASGTFKAGDWSVDLTGAFWICTTAGTVGSGCVFTGVAGGSGFSNPMTGLGDLIAGGASGTATRVAANTTATRKFLREVGTGSAGTAPVFDTIQVGDLPAGALTNYGGIFGDGTDGTVTLDGSTSYTTHGFSGPAGSVYTLSRDVFTTSLTVNSGVTLNTAGYRVFCQGTVTNNGTIAASGNSGQASGTAGGTSGAGTLAGGGAGGAGNTGNGTSAPSLGVRVGAGAGGSGGAGSGGTAGSGGGVLTNGTSLFRIPDAALSGITAFNAQTGQVSGGQGGGGGGGDGTNKGGGAGGGGGVVVIFAWAVVNSGTISVAGGAGGTPATGNCGGGGGGGGGLILAYTLSAWTAGTTAVTGGTAGAGVGTGANGVAGSVGNVLNVIVQ